MRLTWRDAVATVLVGVVVAAALAATRSWGWPLLGSYRAAIGVLAVVGVAACSTAGGGAGVATKEPPTFTGALGGVARILHLGVAALVVIGLIWPSAWSVLALGSVVGALWFVGTVHHGVSPGKAVVPAS